MDIDTPLPDRIHDTGTDTEASMPEFEETKRVVPLRRKMTLDSAAGNRASHLKLGGITGIRERFEQISAQQEVTPVDVVLAQAEDVQLITDSQVVLPVEEPLDQLSETSTDSPELSAVAPTIIANKSAANSISSDASKTIPMNKEQRAAPTPGVKDGGLPVAVTAPAKDGDQPVVVTLEPAKPAVQLCITKTLRKSEVTTGDSNHEPGRTGAFDGSDKLATAEPQSAADCGQSNGVGVEAETCCDDGEKVDAVKIQSTAYCDQSNGVELEMETCCEGGEQVAAIEPECMADHEATHDVDGDDDAMLLTAGLASKALDASQRALGGFWGLDTVKGRGLSGRFESESKVTPGSPIVFHRSVKQIGQPSDNRLSSGVQDIGKPYGFRHITTGVATKSGRGLLLSEAAAACAAVLREGKRSNKVHWPQNGDVTHQYRMWASSEYERKHEPDTSIDVARLQWSFEEADEILRMNEDRWKVLEAVLEPGQRHPERIAFEAAEERKAAAKRTAAADARRARAQERRGGNLGKRGPKSKGRYAKDAQLILTQTQVDDAEEGSSAALKAGGHEISSAIDSSVAEGPADGIAEMIAELARVRARSASVNDMLDAVGQESAVKCASVKDQGAADDGLDPDTRSDIDNDDSRVFVSEGEVNNESRNTKADTKVPWWSILMEDDDNEAIPSKSLFVPARTAPPPPHGSERSKSGNPSRRRPMSALPTRAAPSPPPSTTRPRNQKSNDTSLSGSSLLPAGPKKASSENKKDAFEDFNRQSSVSDSEDDTSFFLRRSKGPGDAHDGDGRRASNRLSVLDSSISLGNLNRASWITGASGSRGSVGSVASVIGMEVAAVTVGGHPTPDSSSSSVPSTQSTMSSVTDVYDVDELPVRDVSQPLCAQLPPALKSSIRLYPPGYPELLHDDGVWKNIDVYQSNAGRLAVRAANKLWGLSPEPNSSDSSSDSGEA